MTPEELGHLLAGDDYLVLNVSPSEFFELEEVIGSRAYTYRPATGQLTIKLATQMHGTVASWAGELIAQGIRVGAYNRGDLDQISEGRLHGFTNQYANMTKVPDCAIFPGDRLWPTIVFEFGYAESYDNLQADVRLLLEGSEGKISRAIIIKLEPLKAGETEIQDGLVEVWQYKDGLAQIKGRKRTLFPPPGNHASQRLDLPLGVVLREEHENIAKQGWTEQRLIHLYMEPLRKSVRKAVHRHLNQPAIVQQ